MKSIATLHPSTSGRGRLAQERLHWAFELDTPCSWIESFTSQFLSVDMVIMTDHEDDFPRQYSFSSPHLNGLNAAQATFRAKELLILFNGVMRVEDGLQFYDFTLHRGRNLATRSPMIDRYQDVAPIPMFPDDVSELRYYRHHRQLNWTGKELFVSRTDRYLRYIFRTLGRENLTFVSLYKVLDTMVACIQANGSKSPKAELATMGGKSVDDIEDFTYTANWFDVAGDDARHGLKIDFKPSKKRKAVTLGEAAEIILPIVRKFVQQRVYQKFEREWEAVLIDRADQADPVKEIAENGRSEAT